MKKISIVVPCYNEEESIPLFYKEVKKVIEKMKSKAEFELLFVNDGSKDKTLEIMRGLAKKDSAVRYVSFSRNFGKEAAMYAGLTNAVGDYVTTMDVDLQDPPELLEEMFDTLESGEYDCCATKSTSRNGYSFFRKLFTGWFYGIIGKLSKTEMVPGARDFRLMTRQMVDSIISMKEYNRYSKGIFSFVGFKTKWIEFENQERVAGTTKWNFFKLFSYAIDGIVGFSVTPLLFPIIFGMMFFLATFILCVTMIVFLCLHKAITSLLVISTLICLATGFVLLSIGILGEYISKMYLEIKNRPIYIAKETEAFVRKK